MRRFYFITIHYCTVFQRVSLHFIANIFNIKNILAGRKKKRLPQKPLVCIRWLFFFQMCANSREKVQRDQYINRHPAFMVIIGSKHWGSRIHRLKFIQIKMVPIIVYMGGQHGTIDSHCVVLKSGQKVTILTEFACLPFAHPH